MWSTVSQRYEPVSLTSKLFDLYFRLLDAKMGL